MQGDKMIASAAGLLVTACHDASKAAGWWNDLKTGAPLVDRPHVVGEKLMLIVSEVSEAMEGHRKGLADDKLPHRPMVEVELADAVIRIADLVLTSAGLSRKRWNTTATARTTSPKTARPTAGRSIDMSKWGSRFMDLARLVASWSKDPSTRVGAVTVLGSPC